MSIQPLQASGQAKKIKGRKEFELTEQVQPDENLGENIPKTTRKYLIVLGVFQGVVLGIIFVTN